MGAEGTRKQRPMRGRDANPPRPLENPANVTVKAHEENRGVATKLMRALQHEDTPIYRGPAGPPVYEHFWLAPHAHLITSSHKYLLTL